MAFPPREKVRFAQTVQVLLPKPKPALQDVQFPLVASHVAQTVQAEQTVAPPVEKVSLGQGAQVPLLT